jgi:hypothetical protein
MTFKVVMAGLDPAIHVFLSALLRMVFPCSIL